MLLTGHTGVGLGADGKFRVDSSLLSAWFTCTSKAAIRYAVHLTTNAEKVELKCGNAVHKMLAEYFRQQDVDDNTRIANALDVFTREYYDWAITNVSAEDGRCFNNVDTILREWCRRHLHLGHGQFKDLPWSVVPKYVEVPFEIPFSPDGSILLVGRMDLVPRYQDGYCIVDHKTTKSITSYWAGQFTRSAQVSCYLWAARQLLNSPVYGAFIHGIEVGLLPSDPKRKCKTHNLNYAECRPIHSKWEVVGMLTRSDAALADWYADALAAAEKMRDVFSQINGVEDIRQTAQEGIFNGGCRFCEFADTCDLGRQPHLMRANLVEQPWNPLEG